MLHQTLILSSPISFPSLSASPSSSEPLPSLLFAEPAAAATTTTIDPASAPLRSSSPAMPSYAHHHSSLDERMDALKGSSRQEESAEEAAAEAPAAWGFAEKDGFSVEDLLDLEEFCEGDADAKDDGADEHQEPPPVFAKQGDKSNDVGSQQSVVSFDLAPPAPPAPEIVDLPAHDAEELEWVSRIMDDSLSELPPQPAPPASMMPSLRPPQHRLLQQQRHPHDGAYRALPMSSPSDPFRTPTICALSTEALVPVKAKRSKRSRASGWSLSGAPHDSTSSSSTSSSCSSSSSFSPYFLPDAAQLGGSDLLLGEEYALLAPAPRSKKSKHGKAKKRGRKPKHLPTHPSSMAAGGSSLGATDRRCSHCGVQKTPQWRAGPEGPKTLCNACGVRYKSGRLLPEYRPACSPTYVSTVHSNSHRKVLEMRRKKEDGPVPPIYLTSAASAVHVHSNYHRKELEMRRKKEDGPMSPIYLTAAPPAATAPSAAPAVASF